MKDDVIEIVFLALFFSFGLMFGIKIEDKPKELTYSQRRDIAITFMCTEHNNWKGAKNFCGSLPLDSDSEKNGK